MARFLFKYFANYNDENLPNGTKICQSRLKICQTLTNCPRMLKCSQNGKISASLVTLVGGDVGLPYMTHLQFLAIRIIRPKFGERSQALLPF